MDEDPFTKAAREAEEMQTARFVANLENNSVANDEVLKDKSVTMRARNAILKLLGYAGFEGEDDEVDEDDENV